MLTALATSGFWTDTVGLIFAYVILLPALTTACIVVSIISGRGEKREDAKLQGRWGRRRPDADS